MRIVCTMSTRCSAEVCAEGGSYDNPSCPCAERHPDHVRTIRVVTTAPDDTTDGHLECAHGDHIDAAHGMPNSPALITTMTWADDMTTQASAIVTYVGALYGQPTP